MSMVLVHVAKWSILGLSLPCAAGKGTMNGMIYGMQPTISEVFVVHFPLAVSLVLILKIPGIIGSQEEYVSHHIDEVMGKLS